MGLKRDLWLGFSSAWRLLTAIPLPGDGTVDAKRSLRWFPVVGILLAGCMLGVMDVLGGLAASWPAGAAFLVVAVLSVATGGLHLDGVADWADAFWNVRDRERTLAIMKDSRTGAFGVIALVLLLLGKWVCLTKLFDAGAGGWLVCAMAAGRAAQVVLAVSHPYARTEGTGRLFVQGAEMRDAHVAMAIAVVASLLFAGPLLRIASALVLSYLMVRGFGTWCARRVGGVTGDLLGAGGELCELMILFFAAAWL